MFDVHLLSHCNHQGKYVFPAVKLSPALLTVKAKSKGSFYGEMTGYLHMADIAELGGLFIADISPLRAARRKGTTGWILSIVTPVQI